MFLILLNRQTGHLTHLIESRGLFNLGCSSAAAGVLFKNIELSETSPRFRRRPFGRDPIFNMLNVCRNGVNRNVLGFVEGNRLNISMGE